MKTLIHNLRRPYKCIKICTNHANVLCKNYSAQICQVKINEHKVHMSRMKCCNSCTTCSNPSLRLRILNQAIQCIISKEIFIAYSAYKISAYFASGRVLATGLLDTHIRHKLTAQIPSPIPGGTCNGCEGYPQSGSKMLIFCSFVHFYSFFPYLVFKRFRGSLWRF